MAGMKSSESDIQSGETSWFLYLIRCKDGALYTGITTDVSRRLAEHQAGKGAKYLRGKAPLELVLQQEMGSRSAALIAEAAIKKLSKADKELIISTGWPMAQCPSRGPVA